MPEMNQTPRSWLKQFQAMPNDSRTKTLIVALAVCLVCSIVVSTAAVSLKPLQERNKTLDMKKNILEVAGLLQPGADIEVLFDQIQLRIVDLETGEYTEAVDPKSYDQRKAAKDPALAVAIAPQQDIASIGRRARYATVYLVKQNDSVKTIILPIHGYGLWSTLYGFLALEPDGNTVYGLRYYEHTETPGLGAEVDNPDWRALWKGKQLFDETGKLRIAVIKGKVTPEAPEAPFQVDGLAGATLTSDGVTNMLRYWLSKQGFGAYLHKIRSQRG